MKLKKKLKNRLLSYLFNAIDVDKPLDISVLSEVDIKRYASEAKAIQMTTLYNDMVSDLKYRAKELLFIKSQTPEEMQFAKAMLYNIDVIEKTVNKFKNYK